MRNLISTKPERVTKWIGEASYAEHCGCLRSPANSSYIHQLCENEYVWGCDNDCFVGYNPRRIARFLDRFQDYATYCTFFNCPDSLIRIGGVIKGDAKGTLKQFREWQPKIRQLGWRIAFTLQNDMEQYAIPWDDFDALFIGSSDAYRYGTHRSYVQECVHEAKAQCKWVHIGRVNTIRRIRYWHDVGADSFDGTGFTFYPRRAASLLPFHAFPVRQLTLFD